MHEQGNSLLIPNVRENDVSSVCCVANNTQGFSMHCEYVTILSKFLNIKVLDQKDAYMTIIMSPDNGL